MARAFVFGDNIDTDRLAPGHAMKFAPEDMAQFCLQSLDPGFAASVRTGDIVVGGTNFGMGSAREQAVSALLTLGVGAVLARSFGRIFYRNAINLGLPVFVLPDEAIICDGAELALDIHSGSLKDLTMGTHHALMPLPPHVMAIIRDGGLMPHLVLRLAKKRAL